jgi:hypothetical protein
VGKGQSVRIEMLVLGGFVHWRKRSNAALPIEEVLEDGSYLSHIYPSKKAQRRKRNGLLVRVIEYELEGVEDAEPLYRLITTILDPSQGPAEELAALYAQRWEIETLLDEFKTHLRGGQVVLRSKTPELVQQEFYGMMLAHKAVRTLRASPHFSRPVRNAHGVRTFVGASAGIGGG